MGTRWNLSLPFLERRWNASLPFLSPSRVHPFAEFGRGEAKCLRKARDIFDSRVAQAALDAADVGRIKTRAFSEFFLREPFRLALTANVQPKGGENSIAFRHD